MFFHSTGITELKSGRSEGSNLQLITPLETKTKVEASLYEALRNENKRVSETRMGEHLSGNGLVSVTMS